MTERFIRLGALPDVLLYDDADFTSAIETDAPIKSGTPIDPNDVLRLQDVGTSTGNVVGPASSVDSNIAEFSGVSGKSIKDGGLSHVNVADAITKKHIQNTDQYLDEGGANEVTAANAADAVAKKHSHADVTQDITVVIDVVGPVTAVLHFTNGLLTSVT
jgi:hypothetical protein